MRGLAAAVLLVVARTGLCAPSWGQIKSPGLGKLVGHVVRRGGCRAPCWALIPAPVGPGTQDRELCVHFRGHSGSEPRRGGQYAAGSARHAASHRQATDSPRLHAAAALVGDVGIAASSLTDVTWGDPGGGPSPRMLHGSTVRNGFLYVFGGRDAGGYTNDLYVYTPSGFGGGSWASVAQNALIAARWVGCGSSRRLRLSRLTRGRAARSSEHAVALLEDSSSGQTEQYMAVFGGCVATAGPANCRSLVPPLPGAALTACVPVAQRWALRGAGRAESV